MINQAGSPAFAEERKVMTLRKLRKGRCVECKRKFGSRENTKTGMTQPTIVKDQLSYACA